MGLVAPHEPVMLFCGLLVRDLAVAREAIERIEKLVGPADFCSLPIEFTFTNYYAEEMGAGLLRLFASFRERISPTEIIRMKLETNRIETDLADNESPVRRRVNLDPGYLTPHSVVLVSTKNFQHRIPIGEGIYAEQELFFGRHEVRYLPWTYPDYRTPAYAEIFLQMRQLLRRSHY